MPLPFELRAVEMALKDSKGRNIAEKIDELDSKPAGDTLSFVYGEDITGPDNYYYKLTATGANKIKNAKLPITIKQVGGGPSATSINITIATMYQLFESGEFVTYAQGYYTDDITKVITLRVETDAAIPSSITNTSNAPYIHKISTQIGSGVFYFYMLSFDANPYQIGGAIDLNNVLVKGTGIVDPIYPIMLLPISYSNYTLKHELVMDAGPRYPHISLIVTIDGVDNIVTSIIDTVTPL